jgi:hypothetical protein
MFKKQARYFCKYPQYFDLILTLLCVRRAPWAPQHRQRVSTQVRPYRLSLRNRLVLNSGCISYLTGLCPLSGSCVFTGMMSWWGSGGITLPFPNFDTKWRWVTKSRSGPLFPGGKIHGMYWIGASVGLRDGLVCVTVHIGGYRFQNSAAW